MFTPGKHGALPLATLQMSKGPGGGGGGRLAIGHGTSAEKWRLGSAQSQRARTARGSSGGEGANRGEGASERGGKW